MASKTIAVAIAAVIRDGKILLIERERGDYSGFLALPGGKVEDNEHMSSAAMREIEEECSLKCTFRKYLGLISELLVDGENSKHFLLHLCELEAQDDEITDGIWLELEQIENEKERLIPSDYEIIRRMILDKEKEYFESVIRKDYRTHTILRFD